ncbi:MAG TPA: hypothetical protein VGB87_01650, partial [Vicinamibacteria bacterium]
MRQRPIEPGETGIAHPRRQAALVELTTALGSDLPRVDALAAALRVVTRELQAARGALFVRSPDGDAWALLASQGLPPGAPVTLTSAPPRDAFAALGAGDEAHDRLGLALLAPIR